MKNIPVSDELASQLEDVAKASDFSVEEVVEQFLKGMLWAWEPHLVKDGDGNVVDIFEEETQLWAEENGMGSVGEEGEDWKGG
jgi:hypothetical protein